MDAQSCSRYIGLYAVRDVLDQFSDSTGAAVAAGRTRGFLSLRSVRRKRTYSSGQGLER